jgi:hypothetical protein
VAPVVLQSVTPQRLVVLHMSVVLSGIHSKEVLRQQRAQQQWLEQEVREVRVVMLGTEVTDLLALSEQVSVERVELLELLGQETLHMWEDLLDGFKQEQLQLHTAQEMLLVEVVRVVMQEPRVLVVMLGQVEEAQTSVEWAAQELWVVLVELCMLVD